MLYLSENVAVVVVAAAVVVGLLLLLSLSNLFLYLGSITRLYKICFFDKSRI